MQLWLWLAAILMFVNLLVELEIPLIATQWLVLEVTEEYQGVVYNAYGDHCPNGKATEHICWVMLVVCDP